ncbi:ER membrane protein with type-III transmembrane domains, partial [Homalodisca vitripennis]
MNHCNQYSLWKLHKNVHFQMLKQEQRTLNVLVRSRIDGKLNYKRCNNWINDIVHVSSKLEFQPEYGACKIDASQLSREYVDLHLRPSCKLARVRTVGHTKEVMLNEIKPIHEIRENLQMRRVFTNKIFDPLYAVLTSLVDLPVGKYLLQHTPKLEAFAQLLIEDP